MTRWITCNIRRYWRINDNDPTVKKTSTGLQQYRHTLLWTGHVRQTRLSGSTMTTSNKTLFPQIIPQIIFHSCSSVLNLQKTQCLSSVLRSFRVDLFRGRRSSEGVRRSVETRTKEPSQQRERQLGTDRFAQRSRDRSVLPQQRRQQLLTWQLLGRC